MAEIDRRARGAIYTVGTQSEQIRFSMDHIKAHYYVFIATEADACLEQVNGLVGDYGLAASDYLLCSTPDNPAEIGQVVECCMEACNWLEQKGLTQEEIVMDPTGGRKWMSAGAVMAGTEMGLPMAYVHADTKEIPDGEGGTKVVPDSTTMRIVELGEAYEHVALPDMHAGTRHFNEGHFEVARAIFEGINAGDLVMHGLAEALRMTAELAAKIDNFEHFKTDLTDETWAIIKHLRRASRSVSYLRPLGKVADELQERHSLIKLAYGAGATRESAPWFIVAAERRRSQGRLDGAVLLYYRTIELAAQILLADREFDPGDPDWDLVPEEACEGFFEQCGQQERVALVHCYILLKYWGAEEIEEVMHCRTDKQTGAKLWMPNFQHALEARNLMPQEHGFEPVTSEEQLEDLSRWAEEIITSVTGLSLKEMRDQYSLPDLPSLHINPH